MTARLPDWLIVGAMKSGTTSLARWIGAHPQAWVAPDKELHFFQTGAYEREGLAGYASVFDDAPPGVLAGEATPLYLCSPTAAERIARDLPDAKLIACLREPVDRAYSHWLHATHRAARETRSFERAVEDELASCTPPPDLDPMHSHYLLQGRYAEHLERLVGHVGRDRVHAVLLDDLEQDPAAVFAGVCTFLGIDPDVRPEVVGVRENEHFRHRPAWLWRQFARRGTLQRLPGRLGERIAVDLMRHRMPYEPVSGPLRETLDAHFAPHNRRLQGFLGRELPVRWSR